MWKTAARAEAYTLKTVFFFLLVSQHTRVPDNWTVKAPSTKPTETIFSQLPLCARVRPGIVLQRQQRRAKLMVHGLHRYQCASRQAGSVSFSNRAPLLWTALTPEIRETSSHPAFKRRWLAMLQQNSEHEQFMTLSA